MELVKKFYADRDKYRIDIVLVPHPVSQKKSLEGSGVVKKKEK